MKNTVLFVDDEIQILNSIKRELIDEEYHCIFANSAKEALDIIEHKKIDVIITDMKMPKMNGLELLKKVKETNPFIVRLVISGYTYLPQVIASINQGYIYKFISKPWKFDEEFKPAIRDAIEYFNKIHQLRISSLDSEIKEELSLTIEEIKDINNSIIKNLQEEVSSNDNSSGIYKELLDDYLETLLSDHNEFHIGELINKTLNKVKLDTYKVKIEPEKGMDIKCQGDYKASELVIKSLFKYFTKNFSPSSIPIQINIGEHEDMAELNIFAVLDLNRTHMPSVGNDPTKQEISNFCSILEKFIKRIKGSLVSYEVANNIYLRIILPIPLLNKQV